MTMGQAVSLSAGTRDAPHPFFRFWMPYLYQRVRHPKRKHVFLPLGRDYKPLGYVARDQVDYDDIARTHGVAFKRDPATFTDIWWNDGGDRLWLYDDSAASRFTYFERLQRLLLKPNTILARETAA